LYDAAPIKIWRQKNTSRRVNGSRVMLTYFPAAMLATPAVPFVGFESR
jgi:hypothetical protein